MTRRDEDEPANIVGLLTVAFRRLGREAVLVWLSVILIASAIGHLLGATVHAPGCPAPAKVEHHQ